MPGIMLFLLINFNVDAQIYRFEPTVNNANSTGSLFKLGGITTGNNLIGLNANSISYGSWANSPFTPEANFHIKLSSTTLTTTPLFRVSVVDPVPPGRTSGVISALYTDGVVNYGINQTGPNSLVNHFTGKIGIGILPGPGYVLDVNGAIHSASLINDNILSTGTLATGSFQMKNGAAKDYVLMCNDILGNGIWTDPSIFAQDIWIPTTDRTGIYLNKDKYSYLGIGTDNPLQKFHIVNGNILLSRQSGQKKDFGSLNGSILFGEFASTDEPAGQWGIEYYRNVDSVFSTGGLNFYKVSNPHLTGSNYNIFIRNDGNVGIGTGTPTSKLFVEGSTLLNGSLTVSSLASTSEPKMVVVDHLGRLSTNNIPVGDNLGSHIATKNIQLSGNFITNDQETGIDEGIFIGTTGNVGIKTNSLSDDDDLTVAAPTTKDASIKLIGSGTKSSFLWTANGTRSMGIGVNSSECAVYEGTNKVIKIVGGKVGIGLPTTGVASTMPGNYTLFVGQGICTEAVRVQLGGLWADYVFNNDYKLMSVEELEKFISVNRHLPDVPTREEVKTNGLDVEQTDALLLKKIEELTLYIIDQNKRIVELEKKLDQNK
jgi:hypothetical protein